MNSELFSCKACGRELAKDYFSKKQIKSKSSRRCNECITNGRELSLESESVTSVTNPPLPPSTSSVEVNRYVELPTNVETKSSEIEAMENVVPTVNHSTGSVSGISRLVSSPFPKIMNHITLGQRFEVSCNRYKVNVRCNEIIHSYDVKMSDERGNERLPKKLKILIYEKYREEIERELNLGMRLKLYYNGDKILYSNVELNVENHDIRLDEGNNRIRIFRVTLSDTNQRIDLNMINEYGNRSNGIPELEMNVLSNILRDYEKSKYLDIGNGFYDMNEVNMKRIGKGLSICNGGFNMGLHLSEIGLTLNICPSSSVFIDNCNVLDVFKDVSNSDDLSRFNKLSNFELKELQKILKGTTIECNHQGFTRSYKIRDISNLNAINTTFVDSLGNTTNVNDYFHNTYDIRLRYPNLPLLITQNNCNLPMEVCKIESNQRYTKKLTPNEQASMIRESAIKPDLLRRKIDNICNNNIGIYGEISNDLSINIETRMIKCEAHHLPSPVINFNINEIRPNNGSFNLRDVKLYEPATIKSWKIFNCDYRNSSRINKIMNDLINVGRKMNLFLPNDTKVIDVDIRDLNNISRCIDKEVKREIPDFIIVFIPNEDMELYKIIKMNCDVKNGILSQVLIPSKAMKGKIQYLANIMIKINLKCGGINYITKSPGSIKNPIREKRTMFIGADVCHPSKGSKMKSIACVVCSTDLDGVKYISEVKYQEGGTEIINEIEEMLIKLFKEYLRINRGVLPERIIFERDGVSESQHFILTETEIPSSKRAMEIVFGRYKGIELSYLIVNKRHHTRFFSDIPSTVDKNHNIISGTVIDNAIVDKNRFQFYLLSQTSFQGTVHPACYTVLYEDKHWNENELSLLIYWECYLFNRCTKCISIPPCVKYADLCAYRYRLLSNIRRDNVETTDETIFVHPRIRNSMYFA